MTKKAKSTTSQKVLEHVEVVKALLRLVINNQFGDVIEKYEQIEPKWLDLEIIDIFRQVLSNIRQFIEDPNMPFSLTNTGFPLKWPNSNREHYIGKNEDTLAKYQELHNQEIFETHKEDIFKQVKQQLVLSILTNGGAILEKEERGYHMLPPNLFDYVEQLPKSEKEEVYKELFKPFQYTLLCVQSNHINNKPTAAYLTFEISPCLIDDETKESYYPIKMDLVIVPVQIGMEQIYHHPSTWTPEQSWLFWELLFKSLIEAKDKLTSTKPKAEHWHGIPVNPVTAGFLAAIWNGGENARISKAWKLDQNKIPAYYHKSNKEGSHVIIHPKNNEGNINSPSASEEAWKVVEKLNPFTSDVLLSILAEIGDSSKGEKAKYPLLTPIIVSAEDILRYKNIQRHGVALQQINQRIKEEVELIDSLLIDIHKWPAWNPATGKVDEEGVSCSNIPLLHIKQHSEYSWEIYVGGWSYWWWNSQGIAGVARVAKRLPELDHRGTAIAKKIGQLVILYTEAMQSQEPLSFYISDFLENIGELPHIRKRSKHWAPRTKKRLDEALELLQKENIFTTVEWVDGYGPNDQDTSKGWVKRWLRARVKITVSKEPPSVTSNPQNLTSKPEKSISESVNRVDGNQVRVRRIQVGWSQKQLADYLKISVRYLSDIENGKQPNAEVAKKINDWLSS